MLEKLFDPTNTKALAVFRILFGLLMFYEIGVFFDIKLVEMGLTGPKILFPYEGFTWVRPMSTSAMNMVLGGLAASALMIAAGLLYRVAIVYFFLGYTYIFLIDKGYYNNHYYLFVLFAFLMIWAPAHRTWSLDRMLGKQWMRDRGAPYWTWLILRIQVCIVYFYGGIAKLQTDWFLHMQPMRNALETTFADSSFYGFATSSPVVAFFTYGGVFFDLFIAPLMWWKRTRRFAIPVMIVFNLLNHYIFDDIGVFPFFMIAATILFFDPEEIAAFFGKRTDRRTKRTEKVVEVEAGSLRPVVVGGLALYMAFQLLFPLRWLVLPGDVDWNTIGQRFSWRMKVNSRDPVRINYFIREGDSGTPELIQTGQLINNHQVRWTAYDPRMTVRFAKFLKEDQERQGKRDVQVLPAIIIGYNGRPYRWWFSPEQDIAAIDPDTRHPENWVPPFEVDEAHTLSANILKEIEKRKKGKGRTARGPSGGVDPS